MEGYIVGTAALAFIAIVVVTLIWAIVHYNVTTELRNDMHQLTEKMLNRSSR